MQQDFTLKAYDYTLPPENIAHYPADKREDSRLFVLHRKTDEREHRHFTDIIDLLQKGDLLVVNDTRVFPARLLGQKESGGKAEVFLLSYPQLSEETGEMVATALVKSSKRPREGSVITIGDTLSCTILKQMGEGTGTKLRSVTTGKRSSPRSLRIMARSRSPRILPETRAAPKKTVSATRPSTPANRGQWPPPPPVSIFLRIF